MSALRIALSKGSLLPPTIERLKLAGFNTEPLTAVGRQLRIDAGAEEYIIARPADVPTYVELGAVDVGFVGSDVLMEGQYQVFELSDLSYGKCKFVVAAPVGTGQIAANGPRDAAQSPGCKADECRGAPGSPRGLPRGVAAAYVRLRDRTEAKDNAHCRGPREARFVGWSVADGVFGRVSMTVATKYTRVAAAYLAERGLQAELIKLYGSIELAPLVGIADWIIDLVSTGRTLAENGLEVVDEIADISCRLIANRVSYKLKSARINELVEKLTAARVE